MTQQARTTSSGSSGSPRSSTSSTSRVAIRTMTDADLDEVLHIEAASSTQPWTRTMFADELRDPTTREYLVATVARDDDSSREIVAGFSGLLVQFDEGHITNIAVLPSYRRQHIGAMLLHASLRTAVARGLRGVTLEVRLSNLAARELYQRFGFVPAGIRPKYYADNGEDALIMWAHDTDGAAFRVRLAECGQRYAYAEVT